MQKTLVQICCAVLAETSQSLPVWLPSELRKCVVQQKPVHVRTVTSDSGRARLEFRRFASSEAESSRLSCFYTALDLDGTTFLTERSIHSLPMPSGRRVRWSACRFLEGASGPPLFMMFWYDGFDYRLRAQVFWPPRIGRPLVKAWFSLRDGHPKDVRWDSKTRTLDFPPAKIWRCHDLESALLNVTSENEE